MHPWEAFQPIELGSSVPWIPTPGAERPIQRVPSGLSGPGGTGLRPCAQESYVGGYHHGFICLTTIWNRPEGVGYIAWPVATGKTPPHLVVGMEERRAGWSNG